ncbi:hypothetical protein V6N13_108609 [Hibiscus sabdariffa]
MVKLRGIKERRKGQDDIDFEIFDVTLPPSFHEMEFIFVWEKRMRCRGKYSNIVDNVICYQDEPVVVHVDTNAIGTCLLNMILFPALSFLRGIIQ